MAVIRKNDCFSVGEAKDGDIKLYYEDTGVGEPIVFLHGSLTRADFAFAAQMPVFQQTHRALYPDMRGHGRTVTVPYCWETPQLADDVMRLLDSLDIPKANIVGHSMGGDVAMFCAVRHSSRVSKAISLCSTGVVNSEVKSYMRAYHPEAIDREKRGRFIKRLREDHIQAHGGDWETFLAETVRNCERYPDFSIHDLRSISMPFLLIYGEHDSLVKAEEVSGLQTNIPNFTAHVVKGAGHFPHMPGQQCAEVNRTILDFLAARTTG